MRRQRRAALSSFGAPSAPALPPGALRLEPVDELAEPQAPRPARARPEERAAHRLRDGGWGAALRSQAPRPDVVGRPVEVHDQAQAHEAPLARPEHEHDMAFPGAVLDEDGPSTRPDLRRKIAAAAAGAVAAPRTESVLLRRCRRLAPLLRPRPVGTGPAARAAMAGPSARRAGVSDESASM